MWSFTKLVGWGVILLIFWPIITFYRFCRKKPRVDNCVTWAVREWDKKPESYLVIRWCRSSRTHLKWPHFMWMDAKHHNQVEHFLPDVDQQDTKFIPDLFFHGHVVSGDNVELEN